MSSDEILPGTTKTSKTSISVTNVPWPRYKWTMKNDPNKRADNKLEILKLLDDLNNLKFDKSVSYFPNDGTLPNETGTIIAPVLLALGLTKWADKMGATGAAASILDSKGKQARANLIPSAISTSKNDTEIKKWLTSAGVNTANLKGDATGETELTNLASKSYDYSKASASGAKFSTLDPINPTKNIEGYTLCLGVPYSKTGGFYGGASPGKTIMSLIIGTSLIIITLGVSISGYFGIYNYVKTKIHKKQGNKAPPNTTPLKEWA